MPVLGANNLSLDFRTGGLLLLDVAGRGGMAGLKEEEEEGEGEALEFGLGPSAIMNSSAIASSYVGGASSKGGCESSGT